MTNLPIVRNSERADLKRCVKKWYWRWRKGLVPRAASFGALELGIWIHDALAFWYSVSAKYRTDERLLMSFASVANAANWHAKESGAPDHMLDQAEELALLGEAMMAAYIRHYGNDSDVEVIKAEIPLTFEIADEQGKVIALHRMTPDLVYRDRRTKKVWLMEHKTATSIRTDHLVIDGQARPYGAMAELALKKVGAIRRDESLAGIMYNFLRKALPDEREQNDKGLYLNKNGTVSKRQPSPQFVRHPVTLSNRAKAVTLRRLRGDVVVATALTKALREKRIDPRDLPKTSDKSCPKFCPYFQMCVLEEEGADIRDMERSTFVRQDPYARDETADEPIGFEFG